ncbi:MAG: N-acetylneuraminate synthase family protein [Gammaproteobacteria bacterium]|nr:N-acetylneuraminate synthase family protein [Gammaproteobacteria bacterium]
MLKKIEFNIGEKHIGDGHPSYIIAEIGSNHNQDYQLALKMIDTAAEAGVDAVKFQTFRAKDHYSKHAPGFSYLENTSTYELIESLELNRDWQSSLADHAKSRGVEFLTSACDTEAITELTKLGMVAYKVASFDLPDHRLINAISSTGKPLILSTGMADMVDLSNAVNTARKAGNEQIVLLQCTSLYPAPAELSNLSSMQTMRQSFGCLTGYSDHTSGVHVAIASVAMGACMIEKHFTLDRTLPGPDHPFAIEPKELEQMVKHIREVEKSIGDGLKNGPRPEEQEMFEKGRRSIHAAVDIKAGEIITEDMLIIKRPGYGLVPSMWDQIVGRKAAKDIEADYWVTWDMV